MFILMKQKTPITMSPPTLSATVRMVNGGFTMCPFAGATHDSGLFKS